jgi:hypothetical protein
VVITNKGPLRADTVERAERLPLIAVAALTVVAQLAYVPALRLR